MEWQLQEAKNRLSELVDKALSEGPQEITRHGKKTVVVLSMKDYRALRARKGTLADFFSASPLAGLDFGRAKDRPRKVDL